ncbi:PH domain-containing protein [Sphingomicrobium sediminis]|uniref:PH domain-containing protein n=1 Tax=Sphingomicrobium sediminis TaxID=2950949 RepID=A0A9X2EJ67_9SPHN|nr:PH domain-containing protein [Sphingomicrobium sediminis]MCM8558456.1 PH domain-containing protein [Sphingomicrobium sediminis]
MSDTAPIDPDTFDPPLPESIAPTRPILPEGMNPVLPAYRWLIRTRIAITWLPFLIGALVLDNTVLEDFAYRGALSGIIAVLSLAIIIIAPQRIWRRLGYALAPRQLRIVRGWLFHWDTIVPLVRVQHIDVARGPLDKVFGTASLIVHTAGTHNSVVSLPGLEPERAVELRDAIRAEIKTDWQ